MIRWGQAKKRKMTALILVACVNLLTVNTHMDNVFAAEEESKAVVTQTEETDTYLVSAGDSSYNQEELDKIDLSTAHIWTDEWNGFTAGDVVGLWDGDATAGLTTSAGESISKDAPLVLVLEKPTTINKIEINLKEGYSQLGYTNSWTYNSWGVYVSSDADYASASWTLLWQSEEGASYESNLITIDVDPNVQYRHIRIGASPEDKYTHSWDQIAELTVYGTVADDGTEDSEVDQEEIFKPELSITDEAVSYYYYGWNGSGVDFVGLDVTGMFDDDTENGPVKSDGSAASADTYLIIDLQESMTINSLMINLKSGYSFNGKWSVYGIDTDVAYNQLSKAEDNWDVLYSWEPETSVVGADNTIKANVGDGSYNYLMIGGNATFLGSWVHSWDQFTEIKLYGGTLDLSNKVHAYTYGWTGSGVDFQQADIVGLWDGNVVNGLTDSTGASLSGDNYMILDLNSEATIDKLELYLVSGHGLSTDWSVYGASGTSLNSSTTFEELWTAANWTDDGTNLVTIDVESDSTYRYIMLGATDYPGNWVHSWDKIAEMTVYGIRGELLIKDEVEVDLKKPTLTLTDDSVKYYTYGWDGSTKVHDIDLTGVFDGDKENAFSASKDHYLIVDLEEQQTINGMLFNLKDGYSFSGDWAVYGSATTEISTTEADWTKLSSVDVDQLVVTDNTMELDFGDGSYRYLMIGGSETFMNSWVNSWNQFTEITIYGGILDLSNMVSAYVKEWNGTVGADVVGLWDGNTTAGPKDSDGVSISKDGPLILDLNSQATINKIEIDLKENYSRLGYANDNVTYNGWAVFASSDTDLESATWTTLWESEEEENYESNLITIEVEPSAQYRLIRIGAKGSLGANYGHSWDQIAELTAYGTRGEIIDPHAGDAMKDWSDWSETYEWTKVKYNTVTATIAQGATTTISYALPSTENTTVVFTSDDLDIAKVDAAGNITAVGSGTARVTTTVIYNDGTVKEYGSYLTKVTVN